MLDIIRRLWSSVYDLLFYIDGKSTKTLDQIHDDLDAIEYLCRPYAELCDMCDEMIQNCERGEVEKCACNSRYDHQGCRFTWCCACHRSSRVEDDPVDPDAAGADKGD